MKLSRSVMMSMQMEQGFIPFAEVVSGMFSVDRMYSGYGTGSRAPSYARILSEGNAYLQKTFPKLAYIKNAERMHEPPSMPAPLQSSNPFPLTGVFPVSILLVIIIPGAWMAWSRDIMP